MKAEHDITPALAVHNVEGMSALSNQATALGFEIVEISGFLDHVDRQSAEQIDALGGLSQSAKEVVTANARMGGALDELSLMANGTAQTVERSVDIVQTGSRKAQEIAGWVQDLAAQMAAMAETLDAVLHSNQEISSIAAQVNILAVNAKIEAARAGDAGRGFAVVSEAINELSGKTAKAAATIGERIEAMSKSVTKLSEETGQVSESAEGVLASTSEADAAMSQIAQGARGSVEKTAVLSREVEAVGKAMDQFQPTFDRISDGVVEVAHGLNDTTRQVHALVDRSETIVQQTVALGGVSADRKYIERVQEDAAALSLALENAIDAGQITLDQLMDRRYRPIEGSNPPQVMAPFTELTDQVFPLVQEAAARFAPNVVFCAALDMNGYLPTHNQKFSQPQSADPVWNAAHCRNRRIFDDRVGLKAGRNTEPFLLQVYRRDMGGGTFVMMKDLSAPIIVKGQHWGGLRLAYTP
ncbi:MAG: methyl-accepting chemotaxis protein [Maritimibacter sp.]